MIVIGKFKELQLNNDLITKPMLTDDYHGEFETIEHLIGSLKTKPLVIGMFYENQNIERIGLDRRLFVMSQLPKIYHELLNKMLTFNGLDYSRKILLNLKEAKDDQDRTFYYILDAMVMEC